MTLLLEHERDGHRVDTLVPNYQGLTGWDLAKDLARHSEDKERFEAIGDLLESHAEQHSKLRLEKERKKKELEDAKAQREKERLEIKATKERIAAEKAKREAERKAKEEGYARKSDELLAQKENASSYLASKSLRHSAISTRCSKKALPASCI